MTHTQYHGSPHDVSQPTAIKDTIEDTINVSTVFSFEPLALSGLPLSPVRATHPFRHVQSLAQTWTKPVILTMTVIAMTVERS